MDRVFIIAEIGVNHNGDVELGKKLIDAATRSGADAVKTQLFVAKSMTSAGAQKAAYQRETTDGGESQLDMLKKLELSAEQYATLDEHVKSIGATLFAAPFDSDSIKTLARLGCPIIKVPSGEITNLPYLMEIARLPVKVFLSTGMSTMGEVRAAAEVFKGGAAQLTLMHCHTQYPTAFADANLLAIPAMRAEMGLPVGYSDHTPGIEAAIAAAAMGAVAIEKHFTLDRALPGPDHKASLEPDEFAAMVRAVRNVEAAMGGGVKAPSPSEAENLSVARKSVVAARAIRRGDIIREDMIAAKRPGGGISPMRWFEVIGKPASRDFAADEQIEI
ncbi:MAG: N-acetylneuraminate synthase [Oscillospiraceae bacterium]|nr:N-acetylneuraminate synthase [Oscillospiraceae bacterium]